MPKFVTGTPSPEESCELWKADLNEPALEDGAYFAAFESLTEHLGHRYDVGWESGLYVRGDYFGDKTQYVYFKPHHLDMDLVTCVQDWVQCYGNNDWRVALCTELGDAETVMVYPHVVRTGKKYEADLPKSLALFAKQMREEEEASGQG